MGLRALVSTPDGRVLAGFASGHLKCFTSLGRLLWKKVGLLMCSYFKLMATN